MPITAVGIAAVVFAMLPFFGHYTTSSSETLNGEVVASSYRDYVALGGGAIGIVLAIFAIVAATRATNQKNLRLGLAVGILLIALFQVVRGFGIV